MKLKMLRVTFKMSNWQWSRLQAPGAGSGPEDLIASVIFEDGR